MNSGPVPVKAYGDDLKNLDGKGRREDHRQGLRRWLLQLKPVEFLRARMLIVRVNPSLAVRALREQMCVGNETVVMVGALFVHMEERSFNQRQKHRHTQLNCKSDPHRFFLTLTQPPQTPTTLRCLAGSLTRQWPQRFPGGL